MTAADIDSYLADLDEQKRETLEQLRRDILAALPGAEECISYGMPAFKLHGKTVPGSRRSNITSATSRTAARS